MNSNLFEEAIRRFDEANRADPNQDLYKGQPFPKELLYAQRMTERLLSFAPGASEALRLAARCQHICRWEIPRSDFPMDRTGYNRWRSRLRTFHAEKAALILHGVGYDTTLIERVKFLVLKKQLQQDAETQTLEDVICLVFLEHYLDAFAGKYPQEKLRDILMKTWSKMSEQGRQAALLLPLTPSSRQLVELALSTNPPNSLP